MERREMIKREIATLEKALEKGDLKSFKSDWLFLIKKKIWAHYLTTQPFILLLKSLVPQPDHRPNLR